MNLPFLPGWWLIFKKGKSNAVTVVVVGSPCSECELLLNVIPWSVILSVHYVVLQAHLSRAMQCGAEEQRCRGSEAQRQGWWSNSWSQHSAVPGWEGGLLGSGAVPTDVNAPGNGPASSVAAPHCAINGWFRFVSSMCLPSSQLSLGIPSSVIFGWWTASFWACSCSFVDALIPVNSRENRKKKRPFISQCLYNALKM